jgi:hypothetical protein
MSITANPTPGKVLLSPSNHALILSAAPNFAKR